MSIKDKFADGTTSNILILITDQERTLSEWPEADRKALECQLPAMRRLKASGLSFDHAYTAACMCSPSRATFQTSQYPIVTGCTTTGNSVLPSPADFPNIASVMSAAGYTTYWIGKWHLLSPEPGSSSDDLSQWGYQAYGPPSPPDGTGYAWDPPDGGWTLDATYLGGGTKGLATTNRNDDRYMRDAMAFLASPPPEPWCLIVSLVNPHDVHLGYMTGQNENGETVSLDRLYYDEHDIAEMGITLPDDYQQPPDTMPRGQAYGSWDSRVIEPKEAPSGSKTPKPPTPQNYANFYARLLVHVDNQINSILDAVPDLASTLVIRFADHGEMGMAHGLVEKFVNAYSQCTHVPLIFSNPVMWSGQTTEALASTVDLLPTLATLLGVSNASWNFVGTDLTPILDDPKSSVQDFVHFTYDDLGNHAVPSVIRAIRSRDWLYAVYLDCVTSQTCGYQDADWELYDLRKDPKERNNLAGEGQYIQAILDWELQAQMEAKGTAPQWFPSNWPPQQSTSSVGGPPPVYPALGCAIAKLPGITAAQAQSLTYIGIRDSTALLARCRTPADRRGIASALAVDERTLQMWIDNALSLRKRPAELA